MIMVGCRRFLTFHYFQVELDKNTNIYVAIKKIFPLYYVKHANILKYPLLIWVSFFQTYFPYLIFDEVKWNFFLVHNVKFLQS